MSGWDGASTLAGLNPSADELDDLLGVLAELDAEGYADPDDDGTAQLAAVGEAIEMANTRRLAREREDGQALPRNAEDRIAHLLGRVQRGTYTELAQADDAAHGCGPLDEFGRCTSPYHSGYCFESFRGEPVGSTPEAMDAWRDTLLSNGRCAVELANASAELDAQADAALDGPNDLATLNAMRQILGIGGR